MRPPNELDFGIAAPVNLPGDEKQLVARGKQPDERFCILN
jgi:hypothetical protein